MIDILFFGRMADIMRTRSLQRDASEPKTSLLSLRDELFKDAVDAGRVTLNLVQMSVNQAVTRGDRVLEDGDEVAFFSVFSGG